MVCEINENAECVWFFKEKKIQTSSGEKYQVIVDGSKRKLLIKNCDPKLDSGIYECKCGVETTKTVLLVKPALEFLKILDDLEGLEESFINLEVEVTLPNQRSEWFRNNIKIIPDELKYNGR